MAQLNWLHDYDTDITSLDIDNIRYETVDGGQNIYKYVDGELVKRLRQFPEEADDFISKPFMDKAVELRRFDDLAKILDKKTPDVEHFRPYLEDARKSFLAKQA